MTKHQEIVCRIAVDGWSVDVVSDLSGFCLARLRQILEITSSIILGSPLPLGLKPKCTRSGAVIRGFETFSSSMLLS